jgi:hypothetical protein
VTRRDVSQLGKSRASHAEIEGENRFGQARIGRLRAYRALGWTLCRENVAPQHKARRLKGWKNTTHARSRNLPPRA